MIPSTAPVPQTTQAQGPNPLIPFLSGAQVGFMPTMSQGNPVASPDMASPSDGGPQGTELPQPEGATLSPRIGTTPTSPAEGFKALPGGVQNVPLPSDGNTITPVIPGGGEQLPPASAGPSAAAALSAPYGGSQPMIGGTGARAGGGSFFGISPYAPIGFPSGRDPRRRRQIEGPLTEQFAPLALGAAMGRRMF